MDVGTVVSVIRDFLSLNEGELCVVKDEVLQIIEVRPICRPYTETEPHLVQ